MSFAGFHVVQKKYKAYMFKNNYVVCLVLRGIANYIKTLDTQVVIKVTVAYLESPSCVQVMLFVNGYLPGFLFIWIYAVDQIDLEEIPNKILNNNDSCKSLILLRNVWFMNIFFLFL